MSQFYYDPVNGDIITITSVSAGTDIVILQRVPPSLKSALLTLIDSADLISYGRTPFMVTKTFCQHSLILVRIEYWTTGSHNDASTTLNYR